MVREKNLVNYQTKFQFGLIKIMLCENCKIPMDDIGYLEAQTKDKKKNLHQFNGSVQNARNKNLHNMIDSINKKRLERFDIT